VCKGLGDPSQSYRKHGCPAELGLGTSLMQFF
jgi:hypothetical protein